MERASVVQKITGFIATDLLEGEEVGLTAETPLLEYGIIDSISITMVANFITTTFATQIPKSELRPENLATINAIADLVFRLR
jgi:acyl carrier protein